ncbi:fungal-specific transcription factor domain-containing protein [Durotheca rogersii]|uniref:fungal-specific transcription factor domain-containing protein n=1 Tax=Durotheca rogersii TaxID=419775 RepID=UPI0022204529|nr:fungal-specific transcription factor domain-containing protein [Durotheca rogersii]KAI5868591.1 fungal-specific transcription factor domain-containing protein [Durotheca rogersii]
MTAGSLEGRKPPKMRPPMRSSIACLRCRKSKIKCTSSLQGPVGPAPGTYGKGDNNGTHSPCDGCIKTGKECIFKVADTPPVKRNEPPTGVRQDRDGGSDRKKLKKIDDMSKGDNQKASVYAEDVLSAPFLTEDLWEQVLDLYKLHFAPELPFLHLPTMKEKLGRKFRGPQQEDSSDLNLVLLGVLTLTARFHQDLVKYLAHICNNQPGNARTRPVQTQFDPTAASEYYADILTMALGSLRIAMKTASVERVAALLMLGLYEWSQARPKSGGLGAWMYVGLAIRMAQYLGLGFGDICEPGDSQGRIADGQRRNSCHESQVALDREIRRRTMFSCFILDRMLACGKERISIIQREDLQIQLPCSEDKFDLAMEVRTGFLTDPVRHGQDDSVLSRFIQLVDIWGEVSRFSSRGGRLNEVSFPWDERTTFFQLNKKLAAFDAELPGTFTFSRSNYFKHENHQASSVYVLLHMLRSVCLIMLHREYIPFVPIRCKQPEGPLDSPTFPKDEPPEGFWIASAEQVFKAAREIVDLIDICQRKDKLPQSTIVLFAIWTAGFVGLYAEHFPQMDTESHMLGYDYEDSRQDESTAEVFRRGSVALALATLNKMSTWLKMASTYVGILKHMDKYFETIKQDYHRYSSNGRAEQTTLRVREGGTGGGLEEYRPMSKTLKDFGFLQPEEHDHVEGPERSSSGTAERAPPGGAEASSAPATNKTPKVAPTSSFTAINHTPIMPAPDAGNPFSRDTGYPTPLPEIYADSWRYHSQTHQQHSPRSQTFSTGTTLDPATIASEANERVAANEDRPDSVNLLKKEDFLDSLKREEPRRIGTIGDLGYFSSGDSQLPVAEMPFGDSSYIPALADSSYQFLQQIADY